MMGRFQVGSLLVKERHGDDFDVGMLTVQDLLMRADPSSSQMTVGDVMSPEPCFVPQQVTLEQCAEIMLECNVRTVPTLGMGGRVDAVLSIGDICRAIFQDISEAAPLHLMRSEYRSMGTVSHIIKRGLGDVPITRRGASVREAVLCMREAQTTCVLVPSEGSLEDDSGSSAALLPSAQSAFSIFSQHDFLKALTLSDDLWSAPAANFAVPPSLWGVGSDPLIDVFILLTRKGQSHVPIANGRPRVLSVQQLFASTLDEGADADEEVEAAL